MRISACAVLLSLPLGACSQPALRADAESNDPQERTLALARIVSDDDRSRAVEVISLLESPDPVDRMLAIRTLERWTGNTNGYDHSAPEAQRAHAVEAWWTWAQEEGLLADE